MYRDRHEVSVKDVDLASLHFKRSEIENEPDCNMDSGEEKTLSLRSGELLLGL